MASRSDSLMDQVFAAVTLPTVGQTTIHESHHEESHAVFHSESHHVESHHEHVEFTDSGVVVGGAVGEIVAGGVVGNQADRRPTHDSDDQRSVVSALSHATSVSVHSSVSQKSVNAGHYDLPPIAQYDMPPVVVGEAVIGKAPSVASSKGSHHSGVSFHSHHSHHSAHSAHTHDSESTITEGTLVNEPIVVGGVVGGSALPTPLAVGQSFEHDAVLEQFKNLHGKEPSVVSSVVPASVHLESDSEDSIAPSKLTHSIVVGGVVGSQNGMNVLHRSHDLEYTDFAAPAYYQAHSVQGAIDARSEDSFGFEKVEYVDNHHEPEEHVKQVVHDHIIEQQTYTPYQIVHENHNVPSVDFDEDRHSSATSEHHHHDHIHHHHHHESHVPHTYSTDLKQSRSNSASTYQSRHILAHNVGPKITEELRPAVVLEEDETHVEPPVMAYVAPIPVKPPRTHEESHIYNAYETEVHHHKEVVKSTIVQEDIRSGSEGVRALRMKFEHGAPPPLAPVLEVKKFEHQEHHGHHHDHHHQVVVEHVHTQKVNEHVQLGGSRKSTVHCEPDHHHHHHHENQNVPSRPSSVASSIKHQPHSRTSTVSTVRGTPVQRVQPTVQQSHNPYGDHQSVRVVKNVREYVTVFGATHVVPPPTPLAGVPRLPYSPRSPISQETFQPAIHDDCHSVKSSRKSSVVAPIGNGVQIGNGSRKSTCSSVTSSRKSTVSTVHAHEPVIVGGNVVVPRSRQSTLTKDNVEHYHEYDATAAELIRVSDMRRLFENYGPAHLPEYASAPSAFIH